MWTMHLALIISIEIWWKKFANLPNTFSSTVGGFPSLQASTYFKVITLVWANQRNFIKNAYCMRKTLVATQLYSVKLYDVICLSERNPPESGLPLYGRLLELLNRLATVASSEQQKTKQKQKIEKLWNKLQFCKVIDQRICPGKN